MFKKTTGQGGGESSQSWSDSVATAPSFKVGQTVEVKAPPCNTNGYFKINVDQGKPFHITAKASEKGSSCGYFEVQKGNGQSADLAAASSDVCAASGPKTLDAKGQEGGTLVQVTEKYGCAGILVTMEIKDGPAPAETGSGAPASDGPQPEN